MAWLLMTDHDRRRRPASGLGRAAKGVTLFELLIVIAAIAIIAAAASPFLADALPRRELESAANEVADVLREAQFAAMNGRSGGLWGVHFEIHQFVLFRGAIYSPAAVENVVHALSGDASLTTVNLSGGGADVHFADSRGQPTETGDVVITATGGASRTVSINAAGMVDVQ